MGREDGCIWLPKLSNLDAERVQVWNEVFEASEGWLMPADLHELSHYYYTHPPSPTPFSPACSSKQFKLGQTSQLQIVSISKFYPLIITMAFKITAVG